MGLLSLFVLLLSPLPVRADSSPWVRPWSSLRQLIRILQTVPEGRKVLAASFRKDSDFASKVKRGSASYTESTFSRTFSLLDGKEKVSLRHEVTVNQDLALADAVVDLAHELVHYTEKSMLDPYKPGFDLSRFIRNGIEGEGGELAALTVECQVAWALERRFEGFPNHRLCERYRKTGEAFDREAARLDYYALGHWYPKAASALKGILPEISAHATVFTSSYAGKPYPVALAEEYEGTRKAACVNNRRKHRLISAQSGRGRHLASTALREESRRLRSYDQVYCRSVTDAVEEASSDDRLSNTSSSP